MRESVPNALVGSLRVSRRGSSMAPASMHATLAGAARKRQRDGGALKVSGLAHVLLKEAA